MDKQTLANYGWLVITILVLATIIALAAPFAGSIRDNFVGVVNRISGEAQKGFDKIENPDGGGSGGGGGGEDWDPATYPGVDHDTGEILDPWEIIIENIHNGTYLTKYQIGYWKPLESHSTLNMQIVSMHGDDNPDDDDLLADGSGYASVTWIAMNFISQPWYMNSGRQNTGGWADCNMRTFIQGYYSCMADFVQDAILEVEKTYYDDNVGQTLKCADKLWIPSIREVGLTVAKGKYEDSGPVYSGIFADDASRIKTETHVAYGNIDDWWLRTSYSFYYNNTTYTYFQSVTYRGLADNEYPDYKKGVVIGFCM